MVKHVDDITLVQTIVIISFSIMFIFMLIFYKLVHGKEYYMNKYYKNHEIEYNDNYVEICYQKSKIV
jgi:hypothetical protein